ncbi:hypothetical protein EDB80DRAFT_733888 [Ilyonectria destructans]|nr:hypothetical protein EDB80DRAFT_733888 [Ilyonectria destructans]
MSPNQGVPEELLRWLGGHSTITICVNGNEWKCITNPPPPPALQGFVENSSLPAFEPFIKIICRTKILHFGDYGSLQALSQLSEKTKVLRQNVERISYCFPNIEGVGLVLQGLPKLCQARQCPWHHRSHVPKKTTGDFNPREVDFWVRIEYDPASDGDQQPGPRLRALVLEDLKLTRGSNNHPVERGYKLVEKRCFFHALDTRSSPLRLFIEELNREWRPQRSEHAVTVCLVCIDWCTNYYRVPIKLVNERLKSN